MHRSFLLSLTGLAILLAGVFYFLQNMPFFKEFRTFTWISLGFLTLSTLATYYIMIYAMNIKGHKNFVTAFGFGFGLKALGALAFLWYFIYIDKIQDSNFILPFFFMYFVFTALLVYSVWQKTKRHPLP